MTLLRTLKQMESVPYTVREKIEFPETGPPRMQ